MVHPTFPHDGHERAMFLLEIALPLPKEGAMEWMDMQQLQEVALQLGWLPEHGHHGEFEKLFDVPRVVRRYLLGKVVSEPEGYRRLANEPLVELPVNVRHHAGRVNLHRSHTVKFSHPMLADIGTVLDPVQDVAPPSGEYVVVAFPAGEKVNTDEVLRGPRLAGVDPHEAITVPVAKLDSDEITAAGTPAAIAAKEPEATPPTAESLGCTLGEKGRWVCILDPCPVHPKPVPPRGRGAKIK